MTPEEKQQLVDALQEIIDRIKAMDENQRIGLLLTCGVEKKDTKDDFQVANLLIGHRYIITHTLSKAIREDKDYTHLFVDILNNLD